jgi:hypothetical protein
MQVSDMNDHYRIKADTQRQIFLMTSVVFKGFSKIPLAAVNFFSNQRFTNCSFEIGEEGEVRLCQKEPFSWDFQPTMRQQFYRFLHKTRRIRFLLEKLAQIERRQIIDASLDS